MIVILDSGHNVKTPGKRSADEKIIEAIYCHKLVKHVYGRLCGVRGINVIHLDNDMERNGENDNAELNYRVAMANAIADVNKRFNQPVILVSVHLDAGPESARGASAWIAPTASASSKLLAKKFAENIERLDLQGNRAELVKVGNFAMVTKTSCPAVLVECAFMTNEEDEEMILSQSGFERISDMITRSILDYIER